MAKLKDDVDSDDEVDNFDSNHWGEGTSKIIAQHYNTL